jgi:hypothetical protein
MAIVVLGGLLTAVVLNMLVVPAPPRSVPAVFVPLAAVLRVCEAPRVREEQKRRDLEVIAGARIAMRADESLVDEVADMRPIENEPFQGLAYRTGWHLVPAL